MTNLTDLIKAFADQTVLVVGDVMLDRYIHGDARRLSPEGPVPVLSVERESATPGGAGNVLSNLAPLGVKTEVLAVVGDDADAKILRDILKEKNIDPAGLITDATRPTTVKTRFVAGQHYLLRADYESAADISPALERIIIDRATAALPRIGALVLSDYGKGVLTHNILRTLIDRAREKNIPVLVDPKKHDYAIYRGASVVTPNRKELSEAAQNMLTKTDEEITAAARHIIKNAGIDAVLATRSQDGMSVIEGDKAPVHLRATALEVFDVAGAGDTVIATMAAATAAGASLTDAALIANAAGGIVVAKSGTSIAYPDELTQSVMQMQSKTPHILDNGRGARLQVAERAADTIARWKAQGLKVGFTNGCFDIIHPGHTSYLEEARARCDKLVIGLNADVSVSRLKGPTRPVNDEVSRAAVLGALASVDLVVLFGADPAEQDMPVRIVGQLKPDIFFKGGDYTIDRLPEAKVVLSYGGQVEIMPLYDGHSTTATIGRMTA